MTPLLTPRRLGAAFALWLVCGVGVAPAWAASSKTWVCDVAYMPSRANWVRTVTVAYDNKRVRQVTVDGVAVHSFAVSGTVILTSQDNERIQLDLTQPTWRSDFRGLATGQGQCQPG